MKNSNNNEEKRTVLYCRLIDKSILNDGITYFKWYNCVGLVLIKSEYRLKIKEVCRLKLPVSFGFSPGDKRAGDRAV